MKNHHQILKNAAIATILLGSVAVSGRAQTSDDESATQSWLNGQYMLGDWGGERTKLANEGLTLDLIQVNDFLADMDGGQANWSRVRATLDFDFGKADLVQGLTFHIRAYWQAGGNLGKYIGSFANPSSLVSANTTRLDSWWFEKSLEDGKLFVKAGQFAGLDFYGVQAYGASYLMEPLGYALGNLFLADYESFDPAGTPAAEVRVVPNKHIYVKSAIFAGNRNPYHNDVSGVNFKIKDSPVLAGEVGYLVQPEASPTHKWYPGSYKFGATVNPGPFPNIVTNVRSDTNYLIYFMANQAVYRPEAGSDRGLDATFSFDWTPPNITQEFNQYTGGARYKGLIPHRRQDTVAVGLVYTRTSGVLNQAYANLGLLPFGTEKAIEVNYALQVTKWFTFMPVVQYYIDTGASPLMKNRTIAGFRTTFTL